MPIVSLKDIHKSFGSDIVFTGLDQRFYPNEKVALIGANGSGKTTLAKLIIGTENPDTGTLIRRKGLQIGYLPQESLFDGSRTLPEILDLIERDLDTKGLESLLPNLAADYARPRRHELAAALNRLRTLEVRQTS